MSGERRVLNDAQASECVLARTRNRSVVGVMTEFAQLAEVRGGSGRPEDLLGLSLELARTPTSPLYKTFTSPDRALAAYVDERQRGVDRSS